MSSSTMSPMRRKAASSAPARWAERRKPGQPAHRMVLRHRLFGEDVARRADVARGDGSHEGVEVHDIGAAQEDEGRALAHGGEFGRAEEAAVVARDRGEDEDDVALREHGGEVRRLRPGVGDDARRGATGRRRAGAAGSRREAGAAPGRVRRSR